MIDGGQGGGWTQALPWLNGAFLLLALNALRLLLCGPRAAAQASPVGRRVWMVLLLGIVPAFLAVYAYQGTWQLGGFAKPTFLRFMRAYNRRPLNPAKRLVRGRILDCNSVELAVNDTRNSLRRSYPFGPGFAFPVGYADRRFGLNGVEGADDAALSGFALLGSQDLGQMGQNLITREEIRGLDRTLTLDSRLQQAAMDLLRGRSGAVVMLRPEDGAILALASSPTYDPNDLADDLFTGRDKRGILFNRALHGLYPPGSTFKIVMAAMAVEQGLSGLRFNCPAEGFIPAPHTRAIRDHEYYAAQRDGRAWSGHGVIGLREAFTHSSNVYFSQLGVRLGSATLNAAATQFRVREALTVFTGSSGTMSGKAGQLPVVGERQTGKLAQLAIGQGELLVTPLHMALVAATIGNDGEACEPRLDIARPVVRRRACAAATARQVQALMREVVREGTARGADVPGLNVAGKTGTAQAPGGDDHSWFVCFAPCPHPRVAMAVLIEHGGYGSRSAVPVAAALLTRALELQLLGLPEEAAHDG